MSLSYDFTQQYKSSLQFCSELELTVLKPKQASCGCVVCLLIVSVVYRATGCSLSIDSINAASQVAMFVAPSWFFFGASRIVCATMGIKYQSIVHVHFVGSVGDVFKGNLVQSSHFLYKYMHAHIVIR